MPESGLSRRQFYGRAFSLLEMLIVIATMVLLFAILLPSLAKARDEARGMQCLGNMSQQAVAAFMYAYERGGVLPSATSRDIGPAEATQMLQAIPRETARALEKMVSRASIVYYCPANQIQPYKPADFEASVASPASHPLDAQILYWWLANPTADCADNFLDVDDDGTTTDEYVCKVEAKRVSNIAIATDQSRQEFPQARDGWGWYFVHGSQGTPRGSVNTRGLTAWKNDLYGDGHAAAVRAAGVVPRWGPRNRAGW